MLDKSANTLSFEGHESSLFALLKGLKRPMKHFIILSKLCCPLNSEFKGRKIMEIAFAELVVIYDRPIFAEFAKKSKVSGQE